MTLQGKTFIVTGGAGGIGQGISRLLAERGANIVSVDYSEDAVKALGDELGDQVVSLLGDVSKRETAQAAVKAAIDTFGAVDGLVNNAHASKQAPFVDLDDAAWEQSFNTGLVATRYFMLEAYPHLKKSRGAVVNFASGAGISGQPTQSAYASAKEAIRGLSRVAANEWAKEGIRVNVVCPLALTEGVKAWSEAFPEMYQATLSTVPLGRFGDPKTDVAPVVAFLLSDDSRYMTGQTLMADGGTQKMY